MARRHLPMGLPGVLLVIFLIFGYLRFYPPSKSNNGERLLTFQPAPSAPGTGKGHSPGANIVVSVQTGAWEAAQRVALQMQTSLRDAPNVVVFSDLEQQIWNFHLHDCLDTVAPAVVENNPDFVFYHKQRALWAARHDLEPLKDARHPENRSELAAARLDKYKTMHIVEKTWALKPDFDWYIFIDADTYLVWDNIVTWLSTMDPTKMAYLGAEANQGGVRFAHGGSGTIVSRATMHRFLVEDGKKAASWDPIVRHHCCGDLVLGMALEESGAQLQNAWPAMSGEALWTMPFGPGTPEYWCSPALTMHHVSPDEMARITAIQDRRRDKSKPLTHEEVFRAYIFGTLASEPRKVHWDNLAAQPGDHGGGLQTSDWQRCRRRCEADVKCFQWRHHGTTCGFGTSVRLGQLRDPDDEGTYVSGWNLHRLAAWAEGRRKCDRVMFPNSTARSG